MQNYIDKREVSANFGAPKLIVNEKNTLPVWFSLSDIPGARPQTDYAQKTIARFSAAGINIVCGDCNLQSGWKEDGSVDITDFLHEGESILNANPRAMIIMRLHVNPPYWWLHNNPDELIGYYGVDLTDAGDYGERLIAIDRVPYEIRASFASEKFLRDCSNVITKYCKAVKNSAIGSRVLGIHIAYGTCGEWHWWGNNYEKTGCVDYGKAMLAYFRKFVREKYKTVKNLRTAYGTDENFDNVRLALPEERHQTFAGRFRFARAVDSVICLQRSTAEAICALCKAVKTADDNLLAGSFYGAFFGAGDALGGAMFEQNVIFKSGYVDFIGATAPYCKNKRCGNFHNYRHLAETMRINGALYLNEMDQGYKAHAWYRDEEPMFECESEEEYSAVIKRNVLENVLRGNGLWYYDHRIMSDGIYEKISYWNTSERMNAISELQRVCEKLLKKPVVKTTDVLIVFDGQSRYYFTDSFFKNAYDAFDCIDAIMKSGAGVDFIDISDIEKCDMARYKCVVFMECIVMSAKTYSFVNNSVKNGKRTVVFVDDCGLIVDGVLNEKTAEELSKGCERYKTPKTNREYYTNLFEKAGAWIYSYGGELVVADNESVMIHSCGVPHTTLNLPSRKIEIENGKYNTALYNAKTGERLL